MNGENGGSDRSKLAIVALGFAGGLAAGWLFWSRLQHGTRRNLFHAQPFRRFTALGHVAATPSLSNARLLGEYVKWEKRPELRRKGEEALRRMHLRLDEEDYPWP